MSFRIAQSDDCRGCRSRATKRRAPHAPPRHHSDSRRHRVHALPTPVARSLPATCKRDQHRPAGMTFLTAARHALGLYLASSGGLAERALLCRVVRLGCPAAAANSWLLRTRRSVRQSFAAMSLRWHHHRRTTSHHHQPDRDLCEPYLHSSRSHADPESSWPTSPALHVGWRKLTAVPAYRRQLGD